MQFHEKNVIIILKYIYIYIFLTGKLNAVSVQAATAVHTTQQQDSFSKTASAVSTVSSSANSANQPQAVGPTSGGSSGNYGGVSGGSSNNKPTQDLSGYNYNYKGYNNYQQYQYPTAASNNYSSSAAQQQQQQSAGSGSQYKGGGQYDKYSQDASAQLQNNPAAAVLGLASTSTTNALSGKVSATTASKYSKILIFYVKFTIHTVKNIIFYVKMKYCIFLIIGKVNMPNLPPGVASMLHHPQYMATGLAPAAFYGLQQPMYGAYGQTAGFDDIAALQRATASAAGLHTLVGSAAAAQAAQQQPPPAHHSAATANALQSAMKGVCKLRKEQSIKKDNYFRFRPLFYF